jgi:hypothetical protein
LETLCYADFVKRTALRQLLKESALREDKQMSDDGMPPFLQDESTKGMNGSGCGTCLLWTVLLFGGGIWAAAELVKMLL